MKTRTAVAILLLAVGLTSMCSAEVVEDRAQKEWKCRIPDGKIYTVDGFGNHIYNVPEAIKAKATELNYDTHDPICISPGREVVKWDWPTAKNIKITFSSLTDDEKGECKKRQPFRSALEATDDSVQSDVADANSWGCAYKMTFTPSNFVPFDPHIIIRGSGSGAGLSLQIKGLNDQIKGLEEKIQQLNTTLKQVQKDLEHLEKQEKKEEKHHE